MDGSEGQAQPSGFYPNGILPNEASSVTRELDTERWAQAEERAAELIARIQPNQLSENQRNAIESYMKCLITKCFSCQVFAYGSVPLKTYLPDGDIDLTAFSKNQNLMSTWYYKLEEVLEKEKKREDAVFHVTEVQIILAKVPLVKCIVENIVVDISFNQLGGLSALCFLEEVDNLISNDHLFKRSIILIKAWCYYESRTLGAHYGLISTYALETLVLYIFHVFDNSFAGPLEVLYRFLEFFSKFDWDKFCVSLWGPVPISSNTDMAADPPRRDGGELSLSKTVYSCISAYTILPLGQGNPELPFSLKHFNIIDPLLTNNNLGNSVNKGNFVRIRSAFSFGARQMSRLLYCPKENLIAELNHFFRNTWEKHEKGCRLDAPSPEINEPYSFRNNLSSTNVEVKENSTGSDCDVVVKCASHAPHAVPSQHGKQYLTQISRTGNVSAVSHTENQKFFVNTTSSMTSDQNEGLQNISSDENSQADKGTSSKSDCLRNDVHVRNLFGRTHSSPQLMDVSTEVPFRRMPSRVSESGNVTASKRLDNSIRNLGPQVLDNHSARFLALDQLSSRQSLFHQSNAAANSHGASISYFDDSSLGSMGKDCYPVPETLQTHQEEQDFRNMMASRSYNFVGHVQTPVNLASGHPPHSQPLSSLRYAQVIPAGMSPTNTPAFEPLRVTNMCYSPGLAPLPASQCFPGVGMSSNQEEMTEPGESNLISMELNQDGDYGFWLRQKGHSFRGYDNSKGGFEAQQSKDAQPFTSGSSSFQVSNSDSYSPEDYKLISNRGLVGEIYGENFPCERIRESDVSSAASSRYVSSSQAIPSRTKLSSENYLDEFSFRPSKSTREKNETKSASATEPSIVEGFAKNGWQYERELVDHFSSKAHEDLREWIPLSKAGSDVTESVVSKSVASSYVQTHQISDHEPDHIGESNKVLPTASMLVNAESWHNTTKHRRVLPFTFYHMWPPVSLSSVFPVCNLRTGSETSSVYTNNLDGDEFDNFLRGQSEHSLDSTENLDQSEILNSHNSMKDLTSVELTEQPKTDILNSDFVSHWQNLHYGRFCLNAQLNGNMLYPTPVILPMFLQDHSSWNVLGRPPAANMNNLTLLMGYSPHFIPVSPLQAGCNWPVSVNKHYDDEIPRYRDNTGTYPSYPKSSFQDRQFSNSKNISESYDCDRKENVGEKEANWNKNLKSRFAGHGQCWKQVEKPKRRIDRGMTNNTQSDRPRGFKHVFLPSYHCHNGSFSLSKTLNHGSTDTLAGMHPLPVVNPSGGSHSGAALPSLSMLYPHDRNLGYGYPAEQLEFGSIGPVHFSGVDEASHADEDSLSVDDHCDFLDNSEFSSLDQPSTPQLHRSTGRRNHQLGESDFTPFYII